jgi:trigger factor
MGETIADTNFAHFLTCPHLRVIMLRKCTSSCQLARKQYNGVVSVKVTSERLPRSIMKLTIELDDATVEKELDRAARGLSQKVRVPGFRPGKAPRAILERFYGRQALVEEASEGMINAGFRTALEQEGLEPVGQASLGDVQFFTTPYTFVVNVPVEPITRIPDYTDYRDPLEVPPVTDEVLQRALDDIREKHVVLREPEEARPAQQGDLVTAEVDVLRDGVSINGRVDGQPAPSTDLVLEPGRLIPGLMEGVIGLSVGDQKSIVATMPEDYSDEDMRGVEVVFEVNVTRIQERILPEWDELPTLENAEGSLADLKQRTSDELATNARSNAENRVVNGFIEMLVAGAEFDYPEVMIAQEADRILQGQESEYIRYGTTAEAVYKQMGRKREDLVAQLLPQGEVQLKRNLAVKEFVIAEGIVINDADIDAEIDTMLMSYAQDEEQRESMKALLREQLVSSVANSALDKKIRARIIELAGQAGSEAKPKKASKKAADEGDAEAKPKKASKKAADEGDAEAKPKKASKKAADEGDAEAKPKKSSKKAE